MKRRYQIEQQRAVNEFRQLAANQNPNIQMVLPMAEIVGLLQQGVGHLLREAGLALMRLVMEEEVRYLAGERHQQHAERRAHRWGHEDGYCVIDGQKVPIQRTRLRTKDKREQRLGSYELFQRSGPLQQGVWDKMMRGLSTRNYGAVVKEFSTAYGIEKSAVSENFIGSRNICELKAKHLRHRCSPVGYMCEYQPGSHSVFSNIRARESDGNRLSWRNFNQMHRVTNPASAVRFVYSKNLPAFNVLTAGQFTAGDVLHAFHADACTIVTTITEELCGHEFSSSTISRIVQQLDLPSESRRAASPAALWCIHQTGWHDWAMDIAGWEERYRSGDHGREDAATILVVEIADKLAPGTAMDLACGAGRNALYLAERGWAVTAVDGSEKAIEFVQRGAAARGLKVQTQVADLTAQNL